MYSFWSTCFIKGGVVKKVVMLLEALFQIDIGVDPMTYTDVHMFRYLERKTGGKDPTHLRVALWASKVYIHSYLS